MAALALGAILVAPSVAQAPVTTITVDAKVTPNKAGTKRHPQGVKLSGKIRWESEAGIEPPIVTAFDILISKGGVFNGGKYPKCAHEPGEPQAVPAPAPRSRSWAAPPAPRTPTT